MQDSQSLRAAVEPRSKEHSVQDVPHDGSDRQVQSEKSFSTVNPQTSNLVRERPLDLNRSRLEIHMN